MASPTAARTFEAGEPAKPVLHELVDKLGEIEAIDAPANAVADRVQAALKPGLVKDLLSGTPVGHAMHPILTDLATGTWLSSLFLDLFGGRGARKASDRLIAAGIAATGPIIVTGMSDWSDTAGAERRIGAVHAVINTTTLGLYAASLAARKRGRRGLGLLISLGGAGTLTVGAHLGGHLSYARGVGVDETTFERPPEDWTPTLREEQLAEATPTLATVGGFGVVLVRRGERVYALSDRCSHRGGPLHQGTLVDGCIECPWHGSRFRLEDGAVERGPATGPEIAYDVRLREGMVEVRPHRGSPS